MSPRHDPTDEAETLPGIPRAGSDLERFPSVPGIVAAGAALSLDVDTQELIVTVSASPTTVTIAAVDVTRTYVILQGSVQPSFVTSGGSFNWTLDSFSIRWELTNSTTVSFFRAGTGVTVRVRFNVIEYL